MNDKFHINKLDSYLLGVTQFKDEKDVVYFLVLTRKILESIQYAKKTNGLANESDYKYIKFFCDWALHPQKNESSKYFKEIYNAMHEEVVAHHSSDFNNITRFVSLERLKEELIILFEDLDIVTRSNKIYSFWKSFQVVFVKVVENQPITNTEHSIKKIDLTLVNNFTVLKIHLDKPVFLNGKYETEFSFGYEST